MLGGSKGERKLEAETRIEPKVAIDEMYRKGRECLHWRCDGGRRDVRRLGDAKEGKDEASGLAKWRSERGRHWASGLQMREQGKSEADEEARDRAKGMWEGESREYKKGTSERRGLYLCGARGGAVRGRESDGAPYPIRKAAVSGCSDSKFEITLEIAELDASTTS